MHMHQSNKQERKGGQEQKLFLKLQILFAGYQPLERDNEASIDYFTDHILYNNYKYVQQLKKSTEEYRLLSKTQNCKALDDIHEKIDRFSVDLPGVNMSKLEIMALKEQMKLTYPFQSEIDEARKTILNNLDDFLDISNGIRKYHLIKAQQSLPNIFANKFKQEKIKNLLKKDLDETSQNLSKIGGEVSKKIDAIENIKAYYHNLISDLGEELDKL